MSRSLVTRVLPPLLMLGFVLAQAVGVAADELGQSWQICETSPAYGKTCATWTRSSDPRIWNGKAANGAIMLLTITNNGTAVSVDRTDPSGPSGGLSANYTGTLANDYKTATGQVTWNSMARPGDGADGHLGSKTHGARFALPPSPRY